MRTAGVLLRDLRLPDFRDYAVKVAKPGDLLAEATKVLGTWLRDVIRAEPDELPALRARRDGVEPPVTGVRGRPTGSGTPVAADRRSPGARTAA